MHRKRRTGIYEGAAIAASVGLFLMGQAFVNRLGIENDEAVFANPLFLPGAAEYNWGHVPLMIVSYAGALKTWLYAPIFGLFGAGVRSLREPVLAAAALTVWLFFLALRRAAGARAAAIGAVLLAVDSDYLMTSVYDWGPVALQHLLLTGGVAAALRFAATKRNWWLGISAFLMGLAMWEKAVAIWMLSGLAIGAAAVYWREMAVLFSWRRAVLAVALFATGALPLIVFNAQNGMITFRKNTAPDSIPISAKAHYLMTAMEGGRLFGALPAEDAETPQPHQPTSFAERASAWVSKVAGHPRRGGFLLLFVAAALAAPFAGKTAARAVLFCFIAGAVAWLEMAFNANTGASVHHTILLWPLPQAIAAMSLAAIYERVATGPAAKAARVCIAAAIIVVAATALLVTNEYRAQMVRNGGATAWTRAIFPLTQALQARNPPKIFCMDWGMLNSSLLLSGGRLRLFVGTDPVLADRTPSADDMRKIQWMADQEGAVFVTHPPRYEFFQGANERLLDAAAGLGYRRTDPVRIGDGFGREIFEIYRLQRAQ